GAGGSREGGQWIRLGHDRVSLARAGQAEQAFDIPTLARRCIVGCMSNYSVAETDQESRIARALSRGHTIDITTIGRRSGVSHRIELVFHNIDGRVIISGLPGRR